MSPPAVIVVMAHPDDEFALTPWITASLHAGAAVSCVWLTDGAWGGQSSARRREESTRVLMRLALDPSRMHFAGEVLGIPDGSLHLNLERAVDWLASHFIGDGGGAEVWVPAWEGGHQDHDAAHLAGLALSRTSGGRVMQYPLYQGRGLKGPWFRVFAALPENGPQTALPVGFGGRVRSLARCFSYRSQWRSFAGLLPFMTLRMLQRSPFVMQPARWQRTSQRPHPGALLYERRGGPTWEAFARATQPYRSP